MIEKGQDATRGNLKTRKVWAFLRSGFKRLVIPWTVAVLTLIPLYKIIFLYSRNLPQESWTTYFHWSNGIWSQNWLWFLPVLFLFETLYFMLSNLKLDNLNMSLGRAVGVIFLVGFIYSVGMSVSGIWGWTKTILIDFQNERLLIYFMIFLLGALCYRLKIFESEVTSKKFYVIISCAAWIPLNLYIIVRINFLIRPDHFIFSEFVDIILLWLGFHLSLLSLLYLLITTFRYYLNRQAKILKVLNENSYSVYIIHVIVIGCIALIMLNTAIPSILKYLILTVSTYAASNLIIYLYRKVIKSRI